ncbi:MAG: thiamine pyrophosphate-binding protein [Ruminococcaceae bacterium]|nr:thiamine pyrophosphate-binding protein [Oscillospiraceae bacterium]
MQEKLNGADYLAKLIQDNGTTHIFYQDAILTTTIRKLKEQGVHAILAHSEFAAGYMADGYARASGRVGLCLAQSIGAANLAASIHDAWLATSPVIAITGKKTARFQHRNAYQESEHRPLFAGMTKWNATMEDPQQLPFLLRQCYREATSGKPRPVHMDILDNMGLVVEGAEMQEPYLANPQYGAAPATRPAAEPAAVAAVAQAMAAAERPVLVAGRGALVSGAGQALEQLARKADIPICTTVDGKAIIDEESDLWCGVVGGYGMDCANKTVRDADLVIFVGSQVSDQATLNWTCPAPDVQVVQIDIDGAEVGRNYPKCLGLQGDARTVLLQLLEGVPEGKRPPWRSAAKAFVDDTLARQLACAESVSTPVEPARLCAELSAALPDNAILVSDTGWSAQWSATMVRMKASQQYLRAAGSLGWAFPASLGAKCAVPERPVVCFSGDGAFWYFSNEMETAMRYNIPTVTVVNNNYALGQERLLYDRVYADNPALGRKMVAFKPVSFAKIASEFGLHAVAVSHANDIGPAIRESLQANRPALVEVFTNPDTAGPLPTL